MRKVLWWLLAGTRGGTNRLRIVEQLHDTPMNANQLANELDVNYRTARHHLELLEENGLLETMGEDYGTTYFVSDELEAQWDVFEEVAEAAREADRV